MHKDERFPCKTDHLIFLVLWSSQVCTTEFNALRFQCSCQIQLKIAIIGLSFSTRGKRKSFSLHLGRLGYHITKAERDGKASFHSAFPLSASEMHLLQDVCSAGRRISLVELKRKKNQKCKLMLLYVWFTVGIGVGVRKNTTENVPWLCVKKKGLLLIINEVLPYWKLQTKFSCVHTSKTMKASSKRYVLAFLSVWLAQLWKRFFSSVFTNCCWQPWFSSPTPRPMSRPSLIKSLLRKHAV